MCEAACRVCERPVLVLHDARERELGRAPRERAVALAALGFEDVRQAFANAKCATLHVTYLHDCYPYPAWYLIKPF